MSGEYEFRSVEEIEDRLRELHGKRMEMEMGGQMVWAEAKALLWVLGYDNPTPQEGKIFERDDYVDVSDYIDVEEG